MRYVSSISPPLVTEVGGRRVRAVSRVRPAPRQHGNEHPVDTEHFPRPALYLDERRHGQRRVMNKPVMIDRRSGMERRRYLYRHIDVEV